MGQSKNGVGAPPRWPEGTPRVGVLGGAPVRKPTFRATPRGRRPGEWRQLIVSVPGRCGTVYTAPRHVFPIVSRPLASRGAPERHVYCTGAGCGREMGFFQLATNYTIQQHPRGGHTRRICNTRQGGVGARWPSVVSRSTRSAESRGEARARRAATLESRRDGRGGAADCDALEGPGGAHSFCRISNEGERAEEHIHTHFFRGGWCLETPVGREGRFRRPSWTSSAGAPSGCWGGHRPARRSRRRGTC